METRKAIYAHSEDTLIRFASEMGCEDHEDISLALQCLVEKAARAIEKYHSPTRAQMVCQSTYSMLVNQPQNQPKKGN